MADYPSAGQKPWGADLKDYIDDSIIEAMPFLILDEGDPVPPGTPSGTIILRRMA